MRFALILLALGLTLQGCGIRGPLYLPDQAPATQNQTQAKQDQAPARQEQK